MKKLGLLMICSLVATGGFGQLDGNHQLTDYQLMLKKLEITSVRPGPSGDPNAPNAANADESKATPYKTLPDPLVFDDGSPVKTAEQWKARRSEIVEHFDREIYGRVPDNMPEVTWKVVNKLDFEFDDYSVTTLQLVGHVDNSSCPEISVDIQMTVTVPQKFEKPVPLIMEFGWGGGALGNLPGWQKEALKRGWGCAVIIPGSIQADNGEGFRKGIIGLMNKGEPRKLDDWGALRAWAWGASRAVDYFEKNPAVDASRVAIEGLSRYGKAAIVAQAYDERIAMGFIGSSGAGGAKILRRVYGEQVENLASSGEYHWFAPNFIKYAGPLTPNDLPVDAHELVAMCAPRPIFISVGSPNVEGKWIDGKGMFLAGVHAGPVYELLGKKGLGTKDYPAEKEAVVEGEIAFRMHEGGHTVGPNWPTFMNFSERYFSLLDGQEISLEKVYKDSFKIGAAVAERYVLNPNNANSQKAVEVLKSDFNCVTSENMMKPESVRPAPGKFNFERSDKFVKLAKSLDLEVVGHVLVWHSQTPRWFFEDEKGNPIAREQLIERMREHIHTVVKHYKGQVKYWDVVNEAVDVRSVDDPAEPGKKVRQGFFRQSKWQQIIGDEFVELAFQFAHEADPDAILIYNDYSMTDPAKVDFVVEHIVRSLKKKGIRIDAVGMQGHWHVESPSLNEIETSIDKLVKAGVKVHITELDMSVLPQARGYTRADISTRFERQDELNPYTEGVPEEVLEKQAKRYREIFDLFKEHQEDVERVTFWGISDGDSWKNGFPVRGRTDYPLLFDRNYAPKPAYKALVNREL